MEILLLNSLLPYINIMFIVLALFGCVLCIHTFVTDKKEKKIGDLFDLFGYFVVVAFFLMILYFIIVGYWVVVEVITLS